MSKSKSKTPISTPSSSDSEDLSDHISENIDDDEDNDDDDEYDYDEEDMTDDEETEKSLMVETETETEIIDDKNCFYKYANIDNTTESIQTIYVSGDERITKPFLTKYERIRILGIRTKQLASGAKPMIKDIPNISSYEIAKMELELKVIPFIINRPLSNGIIEQWKLEELD